MGERNKMGTVKTAMITPFEETIYKERVVEAEIVVHGTREKPNPAKKYTREDLDKEFLKEHTIGKSKYEQMVKSLQRQIESLTRVLGVADRAFGLAVAVVTNVLKEGYWKKTYKKKKEGFIHACFEKKKKIDSNIMKQYIREINELCGVNLMGDKL